VNCNADNCSICRRKTDRSKHGFTVVLVALLAIQAVALALGWIPE
jgi:hypothetical protein